VTKTISINVLPYKPNYIAAKIDEINASDFQTRYPPSYAADSNKTTYWSSYGDKQWLSLKLAQPFKVNYIELVFLIGQNYQSMFDIYASKDNINWDPILNNVSSCKFSGERQMFDFPASSANNDYSYIKYVGHGSLADMWNRISDLKIFGTPVPGSGPETGKLKIVVYPNPASNVLYVSIIDQSLNPDKVSIMDTGGRILYEKVITPENRNFEIPVNLKNGIYLMALVSNNLILYTQRIVVKS
jgi:hypothetical protein